MAAKKASRRAKSGNADGKKPDNSPYVHQKDKINFDLNIREYNWTEKQKEIIGAALEKKASMVMVDGIWGSGKTLVSLYACLQLLQRKKISNILYVRNAVQSGSGTLGWLPGDSEAKMAPWTTPLKQKLDELLPPAQADKLIREGVVESQPVAFLRGTSYNAYGVVIDEMGCMTKEDILLTLSRVGKFSYVFGVGDSWQVDVKNSGFREIYDIFDDDESKEHGIYTFELQDEMDVMRSEFLKYVMSKVKRQEDK